MSPIKRCILAGNRQSAKSLHEAQARVVAAADPEALHDLRVAIRRWRSLAAPWRPLDDFAPIAAPLRRLKRVADLGGPLRDTEVQDALLATLAPVADPELERWQEGRAAELARQQTRLLQRLQGKRLARAIRRLERRLERGVESAPSKELLAALRRHEAELVAQLRADLALGPALFAERARWHGTRLDCKRLRYLLEEYGTLLGEGRAANALAAKLAQDALGELHDVDALAETLYAAGVTALAGPLAALRRQRLARAQAALVELSAWI